MSNPYVGQEAVSPQVASAKSLATVVYALQAASLVVGFTPIVGVIINYMKMDEVRGTWVESHFRWQIRTFWLSVLFGVLMFVMFLVFGLGIAGAASVGSDAGAAVGGLSIMLLALGGGLGMLAWYVYRVVKGWMRLSENQPI
jgi:uncharacterized membrane protein